MTNQLNDDDDFKDTSDAINTTATRQALIINESADLDSWTGPKKAKINWDKVEVAMSFGADLKTCAMFGGVHWNTLERRILARYGEGFKEVRSAFLADKKMLALTKLWEKVAKGDTKSILFANRAFNGITDRRRDNEEDDEATDFEFKVAYNLDEHPDAVEAEFKEVNHDED